MPLKELAFELEKMFHSGHTVQAIARAEQAATAAPDDPAAERVLKAVKAYRILTRAALADHNHQVARVMSSYFYPGTPVEYAAAAFAAVADIKAIAPPITLSAPAGAAQPGADLPWWRTAYDIHEMAQAMGARLHDARKPTSNTAIAREIESRIKSIERNKATDRPAPHWDTIRGTLTGWRFKPD